MPKQLFDPRDARQGNQSPRVLYVLIVGVVIGVAAMTLVNLLGA